MIVRLLCWLAFAILRGAAQLWVAFLDLTVRARRLRSHVHLR